MHAHTHIEVGKQRKKVRSFSLVGAGDQPLVISLELAPLPPSHPTDLLYIFFIHLAAHGHQGCFHVLSILEGFTINMGM